MCDKNNEETCATGINYNCYGPGIDAKTDQVKTTYNPGNDWSQQMYRVKEYGIPSTGHLHPPTVRPPPSFVEPLFVELPNKFVKDVLALVEGLDCQVGLVVLYNNLCQLTSVRCSVLTCSKRPDQIKTVSRTKELYIKYPFLIPKGIKPKDYDRVGQKSFTGDFDDLTTYQVNYGNKDFPEAPELVEAKGLALPEPDKPSVRLPGVPFMPLCRRPLPATEAVDIKAKKEARQASEKILRNAPKIPKKITEYQDNYNTLAKYWENHGLYTSPHFLIAHKPTLPQD